MKQLFLLISLSLIIFSSCKKTQFTESVDSVKPISQKSLVWGASVFKTRSSGDYADTIRWSVYDSTTSAWVDAHDVPTFEDVVYIQALHYVTLSANAECKDIYFNTNATGDSYRFNASGYILDVYGTFNLYEGSTIPAGSGAVTTSGVFEFIRGDIRFKGTADRTIIKIGKYNANNTCSGWKAIIDFASGKVAYIDERVRIENVHVTGGILYFKVHLRLGTNYPNNILDTTINGSLVVESGAGLKGGSVIYKNANNNCLLVDLKTGSTLELTKNLDINTNTFNNNATVTYNGFSII